MDNVIEINPRRGSLNWDTIAFVSLFHILAVVSLFYLSWAALGAMVVTWWISGSWGIGIGYHRLLSHKGFKAPRWLMRFFAACGTLALQSGPIRWVTTHRLHHAFTDTDRDPHSPRHGVFWSHMGWIFRGTAQNQPDAVMRKYSPDLVKDPFLQFLDRHYYLATVVTAVVLFTIGGLPMLLAGIFLRTVVGWHATWLVNSATHLIGRRRFETRDDSRNTALVAAVTFGEGWHNNHHAIPRSARHGLVWHEFDVNWAQIRFLEKLGLLRDVYAYRIGEETEHSMKRAA